MAYSTIWWSLAEILGIGFLKNHVWAHPLPWWTCTFGYQEGEAGIQSPHLTLIHSYLCWSVLAVDGYHLGFLVIRIFPWDSPNHHKLFAKTWRWHSISTDTHTHTHTLLDPSPRNRQRFSIEQDAHHLSTPLLVTNPEGADTGYPASGCWGRYLWGSSDGIAEISAFMFTSFQVPPSRGNSKVDQCAH